MEGALMSQVQYIEQPVLLRARQYIATRHYPEALAELSATAQQYPKWADPWALAAQAFSLSGRFTDALTATGEALERDPDHVYAHQLRAGLLLQIGDHSEARTSAQRLVDLRPERPESHAFLSFAHAFLGKDDEASVSARRSHRLAPYRGCGHQALCVVHLTFRRWHKAEEHALSALQLDGPVASVYHDLGVALWEQRRLGPSYDAFARAAELDPRFAGALARFEHRHKPALSWFAPAVALAAGVALFLMVHAPQIFITVAVVGILAMLGAARMGGGRAAYWTDAIRPALSVVLLLDSALIAQQAGMFG